MNTTWCKLASGSWGLKIVGTDEELAALVVGAPLKVARQDGTSSMETPTAISLFPGYAQASIVAKPKAAATTRPVTASRRSNWRPCGYPGCSPSYCDECDGVGYRSGRGGY